MPPSDKVYGGLTNQKAVFMEEDLKLIDSLNWIVYLIPGLSGDDPHDGSQEGECGDCQETNEAWSQCEAHQQGKSGFVSNWY